MSLAAGLSLVTGATGFVGSAVMRALLRDGQQVRVLARQNSDRRNLADLPVQVAEGAMEDAAALARAVAGCRYVFHVAADYRLWVPDPEAMFRANVEGTRALMLAALAAGVERVVYTSSVAVLGTVADGIANEATPSRYADMIGPYKQSKYRAEEVVRGLVAERGLPAVIVNPSTPIGPRDIKPTPTGRMIVEAARGRMPGFVDTGLNVVHVEDVANAHLSAATRGRIGERYILGSENLSLAEILGLVAERVGRPAPRLKIPYAVAFPAAIGAELTARVTGREPFVTRDGVRLARKKMYFSTAKAAAELGHTPRPARDAIGDAVAWFATNGYLGG